MPVQYIGFVFLCSRRLPEDGTPMPKQARVWYFSQIVF